MDAGVLTQRLVELAVERGANVSLRVLCIDLRPRVPRSPVVTARSPFLSSPKCLSPGATGISRITAAVMPPLLLSPLKRSREDGTPTPAATEPSKPKPEGEVAGGKGGQDSTAPRVVRHKHDPLSE